MWIDSKELHREWRDQQTEKKMISTLTRERERERDRKRDRERERKRKREKEREKEKERERERERGKERERERERKRLADVAQKHSVIRSHGRRSADRMLCYRSSGRTELFSFSASDLHVHSETLSWNDLHEREIEGGEGSTI